MKMKKSLKILCIGLLTTIILVLLFQNIALTIQKSHSKQVMEKTPSTEECIKQMVSQGAINKKPDGLFHPDDTITIAEFTKALLVSMKMDPGDENKYISVATYTGIIDFEEHVDPEKNISRLEMTKMLVRVLEKGQNIPACKNIDFKDNASISDKDKGYVKIANKYGLINSYPDGTFSPNKHITRGEAAKVIVTFLKKQSNFVENDSNYVKKEVKTNGIVGDFFYNKKINNQKVIILLGGSEGGKSWSSELDNKTRRELLQRGYALLSLAYFGTDEVSPTLQSIPLEYFEKSIDWALNQPGMDKSGVAVMGVSKGGEAALLLASYFPEKVKAVIGIVPSSNVFQGLEAFKPSNKEVSSWSYQGKDIPYASLVKNNNLKKALELWEKEQKIEWTEVYRDAIKDLAADKKSAIMLEKAKCPIFLLSGKQDLCWASFDMCEKLVKRLNEYNYGFHFEHVTFENADHDVLFVPGAWQKILPFVEKYYPSKEYK